MFDRSEFDFLLILIQLLPNKKNFISNKILITFTLFFADVKMEKVQQLVSGIEGFDSTKLRHTETQEKNSLPDKDGKLAWFYK